jgi:hypothetical protein
MKMVGTVWYSTSSHHIYQTSKFAIFEQNDSLVSNVGMLAHASCNSEFWIHENPNYGHEEE